MKVCKIDKKFYAKCISSKCPSYNHKTKNCIYQKNFLTADQLLTDNELTEIAQPFRDDEHYEAVMMYKDWVRIAQQEKLKG